MFKLVKNERGNKEFTQFTVTMETHQIETLRQLATQENLKLHGLVKAVLLGYIEHKTSK